MKARELETIEVPRAIVDLATRRTDAIVKATVFLPDALRRIAWNCYLQGLEDGYDAAVRSEET